MTWKLYTREGEMLGHYGKLEAAMSVLGTGVIGVKWLPINATQFVGLSDGGAIRYILQQERQQ